MTYQPKVLDIIEMNGFVGCKQIYNGCRGQVNFHDSLFDTLYIQSFKKTSLSPTNSSTAFEVSFNFAKENFKKANLDFQIGDKAILQYPRIGLFRDPFGGEDNTFSLDIPQCAERSGIYHPPKLEGTEVYIIGKCPTVLDQPKRLIISSLAWVYEASLVKISSKEEDVDPDPYNRRGLYLL